MTLAAVPLLFACRRASLAFLEVHLGLLYSPTAPSLTEELLSL